jgi:enoyl-CoA hydratase/carnithine racemase
VPQDSLLAEAVKLGKQIAMKAPLAVRLAKASITRGFEGRVDDGVELERDLFSCCFRRMMRTRVCTRSSKKRQPSFNGT